MKEKPTGIRANTWKRLTLVEAAPTLPLVAFVLVCAVVPTMRDRYWVALIAVFGAAWLYTGYLLDNWRCPRCQMRFHRKGQYGIVMPVRMCCGNCGLRRGTSF